MRAIGVFPNDFGLIGITKETPWDSPSEEAENICRFLREKALDIIHIRKPEATNDYAFSLLNSIPQEFHHRLVLHSNFELLNDFNLGGFHDKSNVLQKFTSFARKPGTIVSKSCHSFDEICHKDKFTYSYFFLSPFFDSISKQDYKARFDLEDPALETINSKYPLIALGGIKPEHLEKLYAFKFAGAALLGYLWSPKSGIEDKIHHLKEARKNLINHK